MSENHFPKTAILTTWKEPTSRKIYIFLQESLLDLQGWSDTLVQLV